MAVEISCPTCTSLGTERTIAGAMKLALAHAPQHSPVYIAGDGARFTIRHDGKPAIEVRFDDALPDRTEVSGNPQSAFTGSNVLSIWTVGDSRRARPCSR
jgi:hypothetical protein